MVDGEGSTSRHARLAHHQHGAHACASTCTRDGTIFLLDTISRRDGRTYALRPRDRGARGSSVGPPRYRAIGEVNARREALQRPAGWLRGHRHPVPPLRPEGLTGRRRLSDLTPVPIDIIRLYDPNPPADLDGVVYQAPVFTSST